MVYQKSVKRRGGKIDDPHGRQGVALLVVAVLVLLGLGLFFWRV